ncbi:ABC transporter ATP-binding protein [Ahniella affigens]|uniref:ABC transporter ATP-binding protein n=1 Tax=Ahniella affigens TaxID=2021234 RepID=A0A2P1PVT7_9GAMM|nr:ABC transporter ATP-binding protein [Ahniella affigens]AVP98967.1 ABC transporter ATP-binding protein [Ahniella affigens]
MSAETLIALNGVSKSFPKVAKAGDRLRALASLLLGRTPGRQTTVLDGIDLTIQRGQSVGLIGQNGAGKSTLLKIITGVYGATTGTVQRVGSIAPLLELGAGFHPDHTGRENLRTNALLLGMSQAELKQREADIIAFADIGSYIDEPVKHYSSGMVVRLGFAVIAALKPDLLITDEVLAVGDESFQKKCVRWMERYLADGGTLVLVSHSMYHIQKLCQHAIWLDGGRIRKQGDVFEVTQDYLAFHERKAAAAGLDQRITASGEYAVTRFALNGDASNLPIELQQDQDLVIEVELRGRDDRAPVFGIGFKRGDGTAIYGTGSEFDRAPATRLEAGRFAWTLKFSKLCLLPGTYVVTAHALDPEGVRLFDDLPRTLIIRGRTQELGSIRLAHEWLPPA